MSAAERIDIRSVEVFIVYDAGGRCEPSQKESMAVIADLRS
jgi:hypothetical protein